MDDEDEIEFTMRYQGTTSRLNRLAGKKGERDGGEIIQREHIEMRNRSKRKQAIHMNKG